MAATWPLPLDPKVESSLKPSDIRTWPQPFLPSWDTHLFNAMQVMSASVQHQFVAPILRSASEHLRGRNVPLHQV